jgi:hypothetical protein
VALGTSDRVVDHTEGLIAAGNYPRLPHENSEFEEGIEALEESILSDSAEFRSKIEVLVKTARRRSQELADAAATHDGAKLKVIHEGLVSSVKDLVRAFPEGAQPVLPER